MGGMAGLKSWQWMLLLEGSPMIPIGVVTYLFIDSVPNAVQCKISWQGRISP